MNSKLLERAIRAAVWLVVAAAWILVGNYFFWPMLVRAIGLYTLFVMVSMVRSRPMVVGEQELQRATAFWAEGFERVNRILRPQTEPTFFATGTSLSDWAALGVWIFAAGVFWLALVQVVKVLFH